MAFENHLHICRSFSSKLLLHSSLDIFLFPFCRSSVALTFTSICYFFFFVSVYIFCFQNSLFFVFDTRLLLHRLKMLNSLLLTFHKMRCSWLFGRFIHTFQIYIYSICNETKTFLYYPPSNYPDIWQMPMFVWIDISVAYCLLFCLKIKIDIHTNLHYNGLQPRILQA